MPISCGKRGPRSSFRNMKSVFEDLKSLLRHYEEARTSGVRAEQARALWDLPGAFYFVGTVISTIGELCTGLK